MTRSRLPLVVALVALALMLVVAVLRPGDRPRRDPSIASRPVPAVAADAPGTDLLRAWDVQRSAAYAAGSSRMLRDLYVAGSGAGASDVRLLRDYRERGYRVVGMRMQLLALRVLEERPDRLRLRVTDRLDGAVAVGEGRRLTLPRDRPSTRTVTMVRGTDGAWRVAAVRTLR